jgi:hypothetical protein
MGQSMVDEVGCKKKIEWLWLWREVALAMINVSKMAGIIFGENNGGNVTSRCHALPSHIACI